MVRVALLALCVVSGSSFSLLQPRLHTSTSRVSRLVVVTEVQLASDTAVALAATTAKLDETAAALSESKAKLHETSSALAEARAVIGETTTTLTQATCVTCL